MFRMMDRCPTLLLDEVESLKSTRGASESQQTIIAILNAGHRKGATVPRCVGPNNELRYFSVYGPKAFAAIGGLPDTLSDRSIVLTLQRKTRDQKVERFLYSRAKSEAKSLRRIAERWAGENQEAIRIAYESVGDLDFLSDRDADLWMPVFAVCKVAEPERLSELRKCAQALSAIKQEEDEDDSLLLKLLTDIKSVWPGNKSNHSTAGLIDALIDLEDSRWNELDLTPIKLSSWLKPLQIAPRQIRVGNATMKGYLRTEMEAAWNRYLPVTAFSSETGETSGTSGDEAGTLKSETEAVRFGPENLPEAA
jgi:hypothetical protein